MEIFNVYIYIDCFNQDNRNRWQSKVRFMWLCPAGHVGSPVAASAAPKADGHANGAPLPVVGFFIALRKTKVETGRTQVEAFRTSKSKNTDYCHYSIWRNYTAWNESPFYFWRLSGQKVTDFTADIPVWSCSCTSQVLSWIAGWKRPQLQTRQLRVNVEKVHCYWVGSLFHSGARWLSTKELPCWTPLDPT